MKLHEWNFWSKGACSFVFPVAKVSLWVTLPRKLPEEDVWVCVNKNEMWGTRKGNFRSGCRRRPGCLSHAEPLSQSVYTHISRGITFPHKVLQSQKTVGISRY